MSWANQESDALVKKNPQKIIRLREMNGKTIKHFIWHCARRTLIMNLWNVNQLALS